MTERGMRVPSRASRALDSWGVVLRPRRPWKELTTRQRRALIARGVVQLGLLAAAMNDLHRRTRDEIRGPKAVWAAVCCVNYLGIGPAAYFLVGRRGSATVPVLRVQPSTTFDD